MATLKIEPPTPESPTPEPPTPEPPTPEPPTPEPPTPELPTPEPLTKDTSKIAIFEVSIDSGISQLLLVSQSTAAGTGSIASANSGPLAAANDKPSTSSATPVGEKNSQGSANDSIRWLMDEHTKMKVEYAKMKDEHAEMKDILSKQNDKILVLTNNDSEQDKKILNMDIKITGQSEEICALKKEIQELKNAIKGYIQQIFTLNERNEETRKQLSLEKDENKRLLGRTNKWKIKYSQLKRKFSQVCTENETLRSTNVRLQQKCDALELVLSDVFEYITSGKLINAFNSTLELLQIDPANAELGKRREEYLKAHEHIADAISKAMKKFKTLNACATADENASSLGHVGSSRPNFIDNFMEIYDSFMNTWPVVMQMVQHYQRERGQPNSAEVANKLSEFDKKFNQIKFDRSSKKFFILYEQELQRTREELEKLTADYREKRRGLKEIEREIKEKANEKKNIEVGISEQQHDLDSINCILMQKASELESLREELREIRLFILQAASNRIIGLNELGSQEHRGPIEPIFLQAQPQAAVDNLNRIHRFVVETLRYDSIDN